MVYCWDRDANGCKHNSKVDLSRAVATEAGALVLEQRIFFTCRHLVQDRTDFTYTHDLQQVWTPLQGQHLDILDTLQLSINNYYLNK